MTFDGIPFQRHQRSDASLVGVLSGADDRVHRVRPQPRVGDSIGPSTYGGSVNLLSRSLSSQPQVNGSVSYGSFNTRLMDVEFDSGKLGAAGKSRLLVDAHQMRSDGYQTFNDQKRDAFSAKYQYAPSDNTSLTAFSSIMNLTSNTPNQKGATRAQIAQFGDNFLMSGDPSSPLYYGYNFYNIPTNFEYFGARTILSDGWSIDDKAYTMRYHNQQNYNG